MSLQSVQHRESTPSPGGPIERAILRTLAAYQADTWFIDTHWPECAPRVRRMLRDALQQAPPEKAPAALDIGCYNGFLSHLLGQLGYRVTATDEVELGGNASLLAEVGGQFARANFNEPDPFGMLARESFDLVMMGEVIEHVLNHPLGFIQSVARLMKPGALLILTTPNPSTLANALRLLLDHPVGWGATEFAEMPKFDRKGAIISYGGIHYHEYTRAGLLALLAKSGLHLVRHQFMSGGESRRQAAAKRLIKRVLAPFGCTRLLGMTQYVVARRKEEGRSAPATRLEAAGLS